METEAPVKVELKAVDESYVQQKLQQNATKAPELKVEKKIEAKQDTVQKLVDPPKEEGKQEENKGEVKETPKAEEKKEEPKKRKSLKEAAKPFTVDKPAISESEESDIPEPIKLKLSAKDKEIAEYKSKVNDPEWQLLQEIKNTDGKVLNSLLKELQVEDIGKLTPEQIYEKELLKSGVKKAEDMGADSTDPSLEDEMEKFRSQPKTVRDAEIAKIKQRHEEEKAGKSEGFLNRLKEENQKAQAVQNAEIEKINRAAEKTRNEFKELCRAAIGKEHYMTTITPQMAESIENIINDPNGLIRTNEDGSLNSNDLFELAHFKLFKDLMLENMENHFFSKGFEELEQEVNVTGEAKAKAIVRTPQSPNTPTDEKQLRQSIHQNLRPVN